MWEPLANLIKGIGRIMKKRILCVDDQKEILDLLSDYLGSLGFEVITAKNGDEGMKKALEVRPDLIFLDIMMPIKNGYAALRELKANEKLWDTPVIMLSVQSDMREMCQLEGADDFLSKGFRLKEVAHAVKKILQEKSTMMH